jgi:hypothetical protein
MEDDTGSGDLSPQNTTTTNPPPETTTWATQQPLDVPYNDKTTAFLLVGLLVLVACGIWLIFWVRARQSRKRGRATAGISANLMQENDTFSPDYLEPETGLGISTA